MDTNSPVRISIGKQTYRIPLSWDAVSIGRFQELYTLNTHGLTGEQASQLLVATMLDASLEDIATLPMKTLKEIEALVSFCQSNPVSLRHKWIKVGNVTYGLTPIELMTAGEFIDLDSRSKNAVSNLHEIAAILYRPIVAGRRTARIHGHKSGLQKLWHRLRSKLRTAVSTSYEVEDYDPVTRDERATLFQERVSVNDIWGAVLFFSLFAIEFTKHTTDSLLMGEAMKKQAAKRTLTTPAMGGSPS